MSSLNVQIPEKLKATRVELEEEMGVIRQHFSDGSSILIERCHYDAISFAAMSFAIAAPTEAQRLIDEGAL